MFNEKQLIINYEEIKNFFEFCICPICGYVILDPKQCKKCDNCFCKKCILQKTECPFSCGDIHLRPSLLLQKLLSKLKFKCINKCEVEIPYDQLERHYLGGCKKENYYQKFELMEQEYNRKIKELENEKEEMIESMKSIDINNYSFEKEEDYYVSRFHPHLLKYDNGTRLTHQCDVCGCSIKAPVQSFFCEKCDYDYCTVCVLLEKQNEKYINN